MCGILRTSARRASFDFELACARSALGTNGKNCSIPIACAYLIGIAISRVALGLALVALVGCRDRDRAAPDSVALRLPVPPARTPQYLALEQLPAATVRWQVELGPPAAVPDLVAHPPLVVGGLVIIAASRVGYVALDRATGAVAWRRPASPTLANPLVHDGELVLVHDCEGEVAAAVGTVVLACFDRVDPRDVAVRQAGVIRTAESATGDCAQPGAWTIARAASALTLARGDCRWTLSLPGGDAVRTASRAVADDDDDIVLASSQGVWRRETHGQRSYVYDVGVRLPGLSVLAVAAGAVVVRLDGSLLRDYVAAADGAWWWPLPAPDGARSTPVGVTRADDDVVVFFDGVRVAALTAPSASPTPR